jgi:polyhydroxybutyrate depolymerase
LSSSSLRFRSASLGQRNGITTAPAATQLPHLHEKDPTSVDSLTWSNGDHTPIAVLYTVHGGGHVVPQPAFRYPCMLGRTAGDLISTMMACLIWR